MAVVNYFVNFTVDDGTTVSGGFSVDYSSSTPTVTGINMSTSGDDFWTYAGGVVLTGSPEAGWQIAGFNDDFMNSRFMTIGFTDMAEDGSSITFGPETTSLGGAFFTTGSIVETPSLACFLAGTHIETARGAVAIENLNIGDQILTQDGREVAVKWVGHQHIYPAFAKMLDSLPVCISAGALGNGLPQRDLYVSPDHAMYVDEALLVHAKALVNGSTIYQPTQWQGNIEYLHVETENHEIILAEGAPAETFIDNVSRKLFNNHAEYVALYPDAKPMTELGIPRVKYARQLPQAIKNNLPTLAHTILPTAQSAV